MNYALLIEIIQTILASIYYTACTFSTAFFVGLKIKVDVLDRKEKKKKQTDSLLFIDFFYSYFIWGKANIFNLKSINILYLYKKKKFPL